MSGVFSFQIWKQRFSLTRKLGLKSLRGLDKLREFIIGYDIKHRVSTVVLDAMKNSVSSTEVGAFEFEILKRDWQIKTAKMPGITVRELEQIVRAEPDGPAYLSIVYKEKTDASYYAALLLRFINDDAESTARLLACGALAPSLRKACCGSFESASPSCWHRRFANASQARDSNSSSDAKKFESAFQSGRDLARARASVMHHEYTVLLDAQTTAAGVSAERETELEHLSAQARANGNESQRMTPAHVDGGLTCRALFN